MEFNIQFCIFTIDSEGPWYLVTQMFAEAQICCIKMKLKNGSTDGSKKSNL